MLFEPKEPLLPKASFSEQIYSFSCGFQMESQVSSEYQLTIISLPRNGSISPFLGTPTYN